LLRRMKAFLERISAFLYGFSVLDKLTVANAQELL